MANRLEFMVNFTVKQFLIILVVSYLAFSLLFFALSEFFPGHEIVNVGSGNSVSIMESFYFSLCTISKSCSENYSAAGISQFVVSLEVVAGLVLFGMFISKLVGARTNKMLEKIYEGQFKQKLKEYRNTLAEYRSFFTDISNKALQSKNKEEVMKEIAQHIKNKGSDNYLRIISSRMNACLLFLENNYLVSFLDKKFDDLVLTNLLHSIKVTLLQVRGGVAKLNKSEFEWLNYYARNNLKAISENSLKIAGIIEKRLIEPVPKEALENVNVIRREAEKIRKFLEWQG